MKILLNTRMRTGYKIPVYFEEVLNVTRWNLCFSHFQECILCGSGIEGNKMPYDCEPFGVSYNDLRWMNRLPIDRIFCRTCYDRWQNRFIHSPTCDTLFHLLLEVLEPHFKCLKGKGKEENKKIIYITLTKEIIDLVEKEMDAFYLRQSRQFNKKKKSKKRRA